MTVPKVRSIIKDYFTSAQTILTSILSKDPEELVIGEQRIVGRLTGGDVAAIAIGIADNNILQVDHASSADNDYAKFTAAGIEGRSYTEVQTDLDVVRSVSLVVAASDGTTLETTQADTLCTGANDDVDINAASDALS